jgi:hypothetical protein
MQLATNGYLMNLRLASYVTPCCGVERCRKVTPMDLMRIQTMSKPSPDLVYVLGSVYIWFAVAGLIFLAVSIHLEHTTSYFCLSY